VSTNFTKRVKKKGTKLILKTKVYLRNVNFSF
jgi:hypothetical protein